MCQSSAELVMIFCGPSFCLDAICSQVYHYHYYYYYPFVVVVVMMSLSGSAYTGKQMPRRDQEFNQIHVVLEYTFDINAVTGLPAARSQISGPNF